jgi:hypothetical protein
MRTFIAVLMVGFLGVTFDSHAQIHPESGQPRNGIVNNSSIQPAESESRLEIFIDGSWHPDIDGRFDPAKPTVVLIHGWQNGNLDKTGHLISDSIDEYWNSATAALQTRVTSDSGEGDINLLGWNWLARSSTYLLDIPAVVPVEDTFNEGLLLTGVLRNLNPEGKVHLIGHSLGAKVAGVTGLFSKSLPIDQVTLFDAPENLTSDSLLKGFLDTTPVYLHDDIRELLARNIFVDSYSTAFGTNYQEFGIRCVDLNMKPPISLAGVIQTAVEAHRYPVNWYFGGNSGTLGTPAGTIDPATGQISQSIGAAWSKVLNRTDSDESIDAGRNTYMIGPKPESPIEGLQFELFSRPEKPYTLIPVASLRSTKTTTTIDLPLTTTGSLRWLRQGDVVFDETENVTQAVLTTDSPVFLFTDLTVPQGVVTLAFNFRLDNPLADDKLTVFMNDKLLWTFDGEAFPEDSETFLTTNLIDITEFAGQAATLTFCYASREIGRTARIADIRLTGKQRLPFYELETGSVGQGNVFPRYRSCEKGTTVSLVAIPKDGYQVMAWQGAELFRAPTVTNTVTMTKDRTVDVFFVPDGFANCLFPSLGLPLILGAGFSLLGKNHLQA